MRGAAPDAGRGLRRALLELEMQNEMQQAKATEALLRKTIDETKERAEDLYFKLTEAENISVGKMLKVINGRR